jgi:hypothetical protein
LPEISRPLTQIARCRSNGAGDSVHRHEHSQGNIKREKDGASRSEGREQVSFRLRANLTFGPLNPACLSSAKQPDQGGVRKCRFPNTGMEEFVRSLLTVKFDAKKISGGSNDIVPFDECPGIVGLISDQILIEVLTTDALVSTEIVAWLRWFNAPYREVVAAFCAGRRLPFRRRQSRAMARPMLSLLMNRPVVFHSPAPKAREAYAYLNKCATRSFRPG